MSKLFKNFGIVVSSGDYIFRDGDEADKLYLIHRGKVRISKIIRGVEQELQVLKEGEFVGDMAVINSQPRSADAVAVEDCELIEMNKDAFEIMVRKNNKFAVSFIEFLSNRLRDTNVLVAKLSREDRKHAVYIELLKKFIHNSKRDTTGNWLILRLDDVMDDMEKLGVQTNIISGIIHDMVSDGTVIMKKDQNKNSLLAMKIQ